MSQHPTDLFRTSCGATAPLELKVWGPGCAGGERRVFEHPFILVGRHERNDLRLEDGAVSRQHAYLQQLGGRVFCVDLGSRTGIRWGEEPRPAGWLRPEQGVQIGPYTLELATAARAGEEPEDWVAEDWDPLRDRACDSQMLPQVTVEIGDEVRARLWLNRALVLVGSSPACRIRLRDAGVSRYHCGLLRTAQGVWLLDLLPGTDACLNGQALRWALVKDGDRLQVGAYVVRVWYPDVCTEAPALRPVEIPAETPAQPADDTAASKQRPSQDQGGPEPAATEATVLIGTLQAELDQARKHQRDAEVLGQQLADSQTECDRIREQVEIQVAVMTCLQTQLEAAEASARELEVVRGERDRWQAAAQNLQAQVAADLADQEQLGRLATDLHAVQAERDRLQTEQQLSEHAAEQALLRVSDLERALTEAATTQETALREARAGWESERQALEAHLERERQSHTEAATAHETALREAHAGWESERQALEAHLERERQSHNEAVQATLGEVQSRAVHEVAEWRQRLESTEQQLVWERGLFQAQSEQLRQQVGSLQADRDRYVVQLAQTEARLQAAEERCRDETRQLAEMQQQRAAQDQVFVQLSGPRQ